MPATPTTVLEHEEDCAFQDTQKLLTGQEGAAGRRMPAELVTRTISLVQPASARAACRYIFWRLASAKAALPGRRHSQPDNKALA
jgi:hypothetical protein